MVELTMNHQKISAAEGTTILEAARGAGIDIPTLCYLKGLNEIGACRICLVEIEGVEKLVSACNTHVEDGMVIKTNSPRVRDARKINVELILSDHDSRCASCVKSGNCRLQTVANDLGIISIPYEQTEEPNSWDQQFPLYRNASKCVKCMRCIQVCDKMQNLQVWNLTGSGSWTTVDVKEHLPITEADCSLCGQCITHCPVGALRERSDIDRMFEALADPEKITLVQVAPAVRTAWGEAIGIKVGEGTMGKLVCALRKIGFDYIFDTAYTADLTIMEEGSEFLKRFTDGETHKWPLFTSCCPGWIRFASSQYPELLPFFSTAKSPQQMFGAMSKTYIAKKLEVDPEKIFSVSMMPCLAKKFECDVEQVNDAGMGKDVDLVLTTREISRMIRTDNILAEELTEEPLDDIFGEGSGAGMIFGASGGVMEAALRSAYYLATGEDLPTDTSFDDIRGMDGWKEADFAIKGSIVKVAVASGLGNARKLIQAIGRGDVSYDFVEIMACPGGCAGGGGQPTHDGLELAEARGKMLYAIDRSSQVRLSYENSSIQLTYGEFLGEPLSERAHELLHTCLEDWKIK